jgi:cysteine-rich repeat protein
MNDKLLKSIKFGIFAACLGLSTGCSEDPIREIIPAQLLVSSPLNFGDSPIGVPQLGRLILGNGGQTRLEISELILDPNDGIFQVSSNEMPIQVVGGRSQELYIQFLPMAEDDYQSELSFVTNEEEDTQRTVVLMGKGTSNIVCEPCTPPPEPECHLENNASLVYLPTAPTDCESEAGVCTYQIISIPCEFGPCDPETGLCPNTPLPAYDAGPPSAECGNGELEDSEECDDGNTVTENCAYGEDTCTVCGEFCTLVSGIPQTCGDGVVQSDEECDDGNGVDGGAGNSNEEADACRENCLNPFCSDGVADSDEECDDGNLIIEACGYGETSCAVCGPSCALVAGLLQNCGDGVMQSNEECDDGSANSDTTADACRTHCVEPYCGDHVTDTNEVCDDGPSPDPLCTYSAASCFACNNACEQIDGISQFCGDGVLQADFEECDDGTDPTTGNSNQRADACRMTCVEFSCGDGWQDSNEECDDDNNEGGDGCSATCTIEDDTIIPYPGEETCLQAPIISGESGIIQGNYGIINNYLTAEVTANWSSGCTNHATSDGNEVVYAIDIPANKSLTVTVNGECANCAQDIYDHIDEVIYLLNTCPIDGLDFDNSVDNCVAGAQENFGIYDDDISETMIYTNTTGSDGTYYIIVDAWCNDGESFCPTEIDSFTLQWNIE